MLTISFASVLVFVNAVTATNKIAQIANYDDIPNTSPALAIPPPDPYKYLQYKAYGVGASVRGGIALQASSFENAIFAPSLLSGGPLAEPSISSTYTDSKVIYFDLKSIADGCYLPTSNGLAAPAINCTIRYTATKATGETVIYDSEYDVGNDLGIALKGVPVKNHLFPMPLFSKITEVKPKVIKTVLLPDIAESMFPGISKAVAKMGFDDMAYDVYVK